jgi:3-methyl-2-oxobutanoate hydroxymethyltransferase
VTRAGDTVTLDALQQMKRDGRKIVAVVVYDYQMAQIVERAGVDIVSAGDSVGPNIWGFESEHEVTVEQMVLACRGVRRGVARALVSCDCPSRVLDEGLDAAVRAARRLIDEGGADIVKIDAANDAAAVVRALTEARIPVFAQMRPRQDADAEKGSLVAHAQQLEAAGAVLLDFTHSGPIAGPAVVHAVSVPVLGGLGGGPWLDGRIRAIGNAVGYLARALDDDVQRYANVARITLDAIATYADDVRAGREIKGERNGRRT